MWNNGKADVFIPDLKPLEAALVRTTHLVIAAHQDDIEIMAYHGIAECFGLKDKWFTGVVVTDGGGSPRDGIYKSFTDDDMRQVRIVEQRKAAAIGEYSAQIQLCYPSSAVKSNTEKGVVADMLSILEKTTPEVVYLHNPADKHDTHVATLCRSLEALRKLDPARRPKKVYGCEVWRGLDWLPDEDKVALPTDKYGNISAAVVGVFDSQINGGKRYDLASAGRRLANATYFESHATDQFSSVTWGVDLTPLVSSEEDIAAYMLKYVRKLEEDITKRIAKFNPN